MRADVRMLSPGGSALADAGRRYVLEISITRDIPIFLVRQGSTYN
jgi:hypothetical protein